MTQDNNNTQVDGHLQGDPIDGVGQDVETQTSENPVDWEQSAKYFQSEKDKLAAENQQLHKYKQLGEFLESRPDLVKAMQEKAANPNTVSSGQPEIQLTADEFDPWEAFNDPSSKSYKYREQQQAQQINSAVQQRVGAMEAEMQKTAGMSKLQADLSARGLNPQEIASFVEFADRHPASYGIDNVLKMWRSIVSEPATANNANLDQVREIQSTPQAGVLQGQQPERKSESDKMWDGIVAAGSRNKVL
jgi:hypothetical protein